MNSDPDPLCEGETDLTQSNRGPEGTPNPIEHTLMTHEATTTEARGWDALILGAQAARNLQQDIASQTAPAPAPAVQQEVQGVAQSVLAPTATDGRSCVLDIPDASRLNVAPTTSRGDSCTAQHSQLPAVTGGLGDAGTQILPRCDITPQSSTPLTDQLLQSAEAPDDDMIA